MPDHRHHADRLMVGWRTREPAYNEPVTLDDTTAVTLVDLADEAPHEHVDDVLAGADLIRQGHAGPTEQAIATQSVTIPYVSPRATLDAIAGSLGLTLGTVDTVQQSSLPVYRHHITPSALETLPSITTILGHQDGQQWRYPGIKGVEWTLRNQGAMLQVECPMLGSGTREAVTVDWAAGVPEPWLQWGDSEVYLRDFSFTPLVLPTEPVQDGSNLGLGAVRWSPRVLALAVSCRNAMLTDQYRVTSGKIRAGLQPASRLVTVTLTLEINLADSSPGPEIDEVALLGWYFLQTPMCLEWQCFTGQALVDTSVILVGDDPPPNGLRTTAPSDSSEWHLYPTTSGNLVIAAVGDAPPPNAPVTNVGATGRIMRGENGYKYRLGAEVFGTEAQITHTLQGDAPDPLHLEYMALQDADDVTWYFWYDVLGQLVRDTVPPTRTSPQAGFVLIVPRLQWKPPVRAQQGNFDVLQFEGVGLESADDPVLVAWIWNAQAAYLA